MTLLITVFAAVITTVIWYRKSLETDMKLGMLPLMYWGASLMWLIDAIVEYIEEPGSFFSPAPMDMLNDAFLGFSVVAFGLVIWVVVLLVKDPKGVVRKTLMRK
ncbi:MAG: hypothetical protein IJ619_11835 [Eubacterium sp.]|nr:hypothetical protein [Eubacterium sp.]